MTALFSVFCLGFPGLFGRDFLLLATQLTDESQEKIFNIDINPFKILYRVFRSGRSPGQCLTSDLISFYLDIIYITYLAAAAGFCRMSTTDPRSWYASNLIP